MYGFAKSQRDNISASELADLKKLAGRFLTLNEDQLVIALQQGELKEIDCHGQRPHQAVKARSRLAEAIHETAAGLHRIGLLDKATMREFDALV